MRDDPQFLADYLRATHGFVQGKVAGYVAEQAAGGQDMTSPHCPA